jgi:hypothetical protein
MMLDPIDVTIDVSDQAGIGMPAHTVATVYLPDPDDLCDPPIVCFAFPGGGYSRRYYTFDMPDSAGGGEAGWHARRGWIFVACDHLGFGDATTPGGNVLNYDNVALGNKATVESVMDKLEAGTLREGYPAVRDATKLGIGQSMGGSDLADPVIVNPAALAAAAGPVLSAQDSLVETAAHGENPFTWAFHWDDEPADIVAADMAAGADTYTGALPVWRSPGTPTCGLYMVAPGTVATEAAGITVPVLLATGERDVVPNPWMEPFAFKSARDITVYVCPRMAHMHNFAHTRHQFWDRIHIWGNGVAHLKTLDRRPEAALI